MGKPYKWSIFNSYVKLPEGTCHLWWQFWYIATLFLFRISFSKALGLRIWPVVHGKHVACFTMGFFKYDTIPYNTIQYLSISSISHRTSTIPQDVGWISAFFFSSGSLSQPHLHADASAAWGLSILRAQGGGVDHDLFPYHRAWLTMEIHGSWRFSLGELRFTIYI